MYLHLVKDVDKSPSLSLSKNSKSPPQTLALVPCTLQCSVLTVLESSGFLPKEQGEYLPH